MTETNSGRRSTGLAANAMGTRDLVFTVLAALAPLTLIVAVAPLHFLIGGSSVPGAYLVAGVVMALFAVGFMTMSRYVRNAGAFYATIAKGLGRPAGSGAAMLALVAYNGLQISTYGALGVYAQGTFERYFGVSVPWWVFGLVAVVLVAALGIRGIHTSARVLAVLLCLEVAVLVVLAVAVLVQGGPEGFSATSFDPGNVLSVENGPLFALVFGAFMGFESTAIFSEEARGGIRTVRRATYVAVAFIAVFYALMTWVVTTAYGASAVGDAAVADPVDLVVTVFTNYTPGFVGEIMQVLLLGSAFAALLALHNAANRYFFALGRERLLPAALGRTHPTRRSPYVAGLVQSGLAVAVLVVWAVFDLDPYLGLLLWGSGLGFVGIITLWALCCLAVIVYLRRRAPETGVWRSLIAPGISFVGLCVVLALTFANMDLLTGAGTTTNTVIIGLGVVAVVGGVAAALWLRSRDRARYDRLTELRVDGDIEEALPDDEPRTRRDDDVATPAQPA
ncbi:APC family permease [Blastococcus sp. SYSU D00820]